MDWQKRLQETQKQTLSRFNKGSVVYVALSGGVDSAVSAFLLKEWGYKVEGVYMKNWSGLDYGLKDYCPSKEEIEDVGKIAKHLDIPHQVFNFEREYRKSVLDYFFREYKAGRTPNPDVMCNKTIKFDQYLKKALKKGADFIATGHYAQIAFLTLNKVVANSKQLLKKEEKLPFLQPGLDPNKDQAYFLYTLKHKQLAPSVFPIGNLLKKEVRQIAQEIKLPVAEKPDSQGICFIGDIDVNYFLAQNLKTKPGPIKEMKTGKKVGQHKGLWFYTEGQRKGIGIGGIFPAYYVVKKEAKTNTLWVAKGRENQYLLKEQVFLEGLDLVNPKIKELIDSGHALELLVQLRYRAPVVAGRLSKQESRAKTKKSEYLLDFKEPDLAWAPAPGQSAVLYSGSNREDMICIGGGVIRNEKIANSKG